MGNTNKTGLNKSDTINWNTESMTTTDNPKSDINNNIQKLVANLKLENQGREEKPTWIAKTSETRRGNIASSRKISK